MRSGCAAALVVLAVSAGAAAEQPVRGLTLRVDDHGPGRSGGTVRVLASDPSGAATLAGNPAREGASLTVALVGELAARDLFVLPGMGASGQGPGWRVRSRRAHPGDGSFTWRDPRGEHGPVRWLRLARGPDGFRIDLRLRATNARPLTLRPPAPGAGGELVVTIPGGDTWCAGFGGAAGGRIVTNKSSRFRIVGATQAACSLTTPEPSVPSFESDPVRPIALSPDGRRLFVANTPDARLEILTIAADGTLAPEASVPVGLEPVSVAARSDAEVWVVNELSDSVSVVDVVSSPPRVVRTIATCDEPRDLVFAGIAGDRAFVTAARRGQTCIGADGAPIDAKLTTPGTPRALVQVFDAAARTSMPLAVLELFGDTPRALAVSPDGRTVHAAIFRSGNRTTTVNEQLVCDQGALATACTIEQTTVPGGLPAPSPVDCHGETQPETGLIVRFDPDAGIWTDELGRDWSDAIRFSLPDRDVFTIDATASPPAVVGPGIAGVGTVLFAMATNPTTGTLYVSNTEANNATRFEGDRTGSCATTSVRGRLHAARVAVIAGDTIRHRHLNKHLEPYDATPSPADKARSLATPVALATDGTTLWVAAFGSGAVGAFDVAALEDDSFVPSATDHVAVTGGGPSGLVLRGDRLYVATRFDDGVSVIDTTTRSELSHVRLHDPEPAAVVGGRRFLYDAVATSDNGEASCGACHVFGDLDGLAWDLGNPDGATQGNPNPFEFEVGSDSRFRALKGPMTTQSLRGLANHGPMHWRGDRTGGSAPGGDPRDEAAAFRAFNPAFVSLIGRAEPLAAADMQAFTDFALALRYPPNPIRSLDERLSPAEERGRRIFFEVVSDGVRTCNGCHVLDPAQGFFGTDGDSTFENEPQVFKIAHLRNLYQKVGMFGLARVPGIRRGDETSLGEQIRGFGYLHDGSVDTIAHFLSAMVFSLSTAEIADVEAFVLGFETGLAPAVGQQVTVGVDTDADPARIELLLDRASTVFPRCEVVVHGVLDGVSRGWLRLPSGAFQSDRADEPPLAEATLRAQALVAGQERTYTCVPPGSGRRLGIDRDADGCLDGDDLAAADPGIGCPTQ